MKSLLVAAVAVAISGCAASRSGPTRKQQEYLKAHPLSPDEERRLFARESKAGDTIDRVRVTCDDCKFEQSAVDGSIETWRVHIPVDSRPLRIVTEKLDEVGPGSDALLTFENGKLKGALIF